MAFIDDILKNFGYTRKAEGDPSNIHEVVGSGSATNLSNKKGFDAFLNTYADSTWVYSCVYKIGSKMASVPLNAYKQKATNGVVSLDRVDDHGVIELLMHPNPFMDFYDLIEATGSFQELTGNAYWLLDEFVAGKPTKIWVLNPAQVKVVPSKTQKIAGYKFKVNGEEIDIPVEQMIHFKYFNPLSDFYGISPLSAGALAVDTQRLGDTYNKNFFENSAEPKGALTSDKPLGQDQRNRIARAWKSMHKGTKNAHKTAIFEGGISWKSMGLSQKDMEFIQSKKMTREDILSVFGVPPVMVGLLEYASYNNSKEQRRIFWEDTIKPKLRKMVGTINAFLVIPYDSAIILESDYEGISDLQKDEKMKAETSKIYVETGIITINEVREDLGLEPVEWGDEPRQAKQPTPMIPTKQKEYDPVKDYEEQAGDIEAIDETIESDDEALVEWSEPIQTEDAQILKETMEGLHKQIEKSNGEGTGISKEQMIENVRTKQWMAFKGFTESQEVGFRQIMRKFFTQQERIVINNLREFGLKMKRKPEHKKYAQEKQSKIDLVMFESTQDELLAEAIRPATTETLVTKANMEIQRLGLAVSFDVTNPQVALFLKDKPLLSAFEINNTTGKDLRTELGKGIALGEDIRKLEKRVEEVYTQAKGYRSTRIARTETISATNKGAMESYRQAGVEDQQWITARDGDVRDSHAGIDGEVAKVGENFSIGMEYPADPQGLAEDVINCRCALVPVISSMSVVPTTENPIPDASLVPTIANAKTLEGLEKATAQSLGLRDSSGINLKGLEGALDNTKEMMNQVAVLFDEYGLKNFGFKIEARALRSNYMSADMTGINIGKKYYKSKASVVKTSESQAKQIADGYKSHIESKNINIRTITHETAHTIFDTRFLTTSDEALSSLVNKVTERKDIFRRAKVLHKAHKEGAKNVIALSGKTFPTEYSKYAYLKQNYPDFVSGYALKNTDEFLAESFASYKLSSKPSALAREMGEFIDKTLKGVK